MSLKAYLNGKDQRATLERQRRAEGRIPAGQSLTLKWPVLHEGEVPVFDESAWDLRIGGLVDRPHVFSWAAFRALPRREVTSDFHCVTRWSRLDNRWDGVAFREIRGRVAPQSQARYVMALGHLGDNRYGYSTNVPLTDLERDDVLLADRHDGAPLDPEHGGPLRLVVPHLYGWKSAKWLRGLVFMDEDQAGYWERRGYHMRGDPFTEERFGS